MTGRGFVFGRKQLLVALCIFGTGCSMQSDPDPQPGWAVSLKQLQHEAMIAQSRGDALPRHLAELGGLTRVTALVFHDDDIILAGDIDRGGAPPFELDHLAVALRNAFEVSEEYKGVLGCTIDPRPGADPWILQDAKTFGGPHRSSISQLFVQIDYELKRVGAGYSTMPGVQNSFRCSFKRRRSF